METILVHAMHSDTGVTVLAALFVLTGVALRSILGLLGRALAGGRRRGLRGD